MSKRRLSVIEERCIGCRICELTCSMSHCGGGFNPRNSLIRIESNREVGPRKAPPAMERPRICRQCEPAHCAEACPAGAFSTDEELAISVIDPDACTGCEVCVGACPYGMAVLNRDEGKAGKCDLCAGDPLCVRYCPAGALIFDE